MSQKDGYTPLKVAIEIERKRERKRERERERVRLAMFSTAKADIILTAVRKTNQSWWPVENKCTKMRVK
jgi:hypothetical protein